VKIFLFLLLAWVARAELVVEVTGVKNDAGKVGLLVFDQAKGFPEDFTKALHQVERVAKKGNLSFKVPALKAGSYAFVILHDENGNRKLDKNFVGYPKEGIAVSGYAKIARPKFAKALLKNPRSPLRLKLLYP